MNRINKIFGIKAMSVFLIFAAFAVMTNAQNATVKTTIVNGENATTSERVVALEKQADGALRARIPAAEIPTNIDTLEIIPDFAQAKKGESGYFILPDGRMGGFHESEGWVGEKSAFNLMPIFGMKKEKGSFMGIVKGLKLECGMCVDVKEDVYKISPKFFIAQMGIPAYEDIIVDYYFMKDDEADYSGMARKYRAWQLERGEVKPLRERAKDNQVLQYTAESIFVRIKHGWKQNKNKIADQTRENEPPIHVAINFDRFMEIMKNMKAAGIDKAEVCSVGGTAGGFDGRFPDVLPIPQEFGGEAKLKEAVKFGQSLGYQMTCHFATTAIFKVSSIWNEDYVCKAKDGQLLKSAVVAGGMTYRLNPKVYVTKFLKRDWQTFRDLGFKGSFHLDVISRIMPYYDFGKENFLNKRDCGEYERQIAAHCQKVFGGFGSEGGLDWIASNLDYALYISWYPGFGKINGTLKSPLVDGVVPFWQLVYHGIIVSNPFYATIDPTIEHKGMMKMYTYLSDAKTRMLKVIEFGGRPTFYFIRYSDEQLLLIKKAYDTYESVKYLQYEFMDFHGELAPQVFLTRYGNGDEIVCNYSDKAYSYKGSEVAPLGYGLYKSSAPKVTATN